MSSTVLATLLEKFVNDSATPDEWQLLRKLMKDPLQRAYIEDWIEQWLKRQPSSSYTDFDVKDMFLEVMEKSRSSDISPSLPGPNLMGPAPQTPVHRMRSLKTTWFRYAAAVLVLVATGYYLWFQNGRNQTDADVPAQLAADIAPGKTGAILTLEDGSQLVLDSLGNGIVADQRGAKAVLNNGRLTYDLTGNTHEKIAYNTMSTPKGRQFHVILPDGTAVWLNAASSITYPTAFNTNERRVTISGELYFEVANNSRQPFIVETENQKIEVLGTSFNINSYQNENTVQTTLLTGAVRVTPLGDNKKGTVQGAIGQPKVLAPGQTAVLNKLSQQPGSALTVTNTQQPGKITAWKNGLFNFDDVDLYSAMRQLERWYNIEVRYTGRPDNIIFKGKIHRNTNLSNVLKLLEMMGITFELKDNTLYVR